MDAHIKLTQWWSSTGACIETSPVTAGAINDIERRYDLVLPKDFRRYLAEGSPTQDNWDDEMGNWWPFTRIKNIPDEYEHPLSAFIPDGGRKFLFFLDHCIWCWAWAISCEDDATFGQVALIGGAPERYVAASFSEFVDRYINDWSSVS